MDNKNYKFGQMAFKFQFTSRENIRKAIQEVSALHVHGIEKSIQQVMLERGYLTKDQVYAVLEAMLSSGQIKKIRSLEIYNFTDEDDKTLYSFFGLDISTTNRETLVGLPNTCQPKKYWPITPENLLICLNIKHALERVEVPTLLLHIIHDRGFLSTAFTRIIPDLAKRRQVIINPKKHTIQATKKNVSILLGQIAASMGKLSADDIDRALFIWQSLPPATIELRFLELLFYYDRVDESTATKLATRLEELAGINQKPRFALLRLTDAEQSLFEKLLEKGHFPAQDVENGKNLLFQFHQDGLVKMRLSDVMILQETLIRKQMSQEWAKIRKAEIEYEVANMQMDRTVDASREDEELMFQQELQRNQEIALQAEVEERLYREESNHKIVPRDSTEDNKFEEELDNTFQQTRVESIKTMQEDVIYSPQKLTRSMECLRSYLNASNSHLRKIFIPAFVIIFALCVGVLLRLIDHRKTHNTNTHVLQESPKNTLMLAEEITKKTVLATEWQKIYAYDKAIAIYQDLLHNLPDNHAMLESLRDQYQHCQSMQDIKKQVASYVAKQTQPISVLISNKEENLRNIGDDGIWVGDVERRLIAWHSISAQEMYDIFQSCGQLEGNPWELAVFCQQHQLLTPMRECLGVYLSQFPEKKDIACRLLETLLKKNFPSDAYIVHGRKLYLKEEIGYEDFPDTLDKPIPTENITPTEIPTILHPENHPEDIAIAQKESQKYQDELLEQQRKQYKAKCQNAGYMFHDEIWRSKDSVIFEKTWAEKSTQNQVLFKGEWIEKKSLGDWYRMTLHKQKEYLEGFLQHQKDDLYELHTPVGIQYLADKEILSKNVGIYPWEKYWQLRSSANNVYEHFHLAEWCRGMSLKNMAIWEQEFVSQNSPLAYVRQEYNNYTTYDFAKLGIYPNENASGWLLREEIALEKYRTTRGENAKNTASHNVKFDFANQDSLTTWEYNANICQIRDETVEIQAKEDTPQFLTYKLPLVNELTITVDIYFSERPSQNLFLRFFYDPEKKDCDGYMLGLNATSPNGHWLKSFKTPEGEILASSKETVLPTKQWRTVTLKVIGDKIDVYLQKQRIWRVTDSSFRRGFFSIGGQKTTLRLDELQIQSQTEEAISSRAFLGIPKELLQQWDQIPSPLWQMWKQARWHMLYQEYSLAWVLIQKILAERPDFSLARLDKIMLKTQVRDFQNIEDDLKKIMLPVVWDSAYSTRAWYYWTCQKYDMATADLARAILQNPENPRTYWIMSLLYQQLGRKDMVQAVTKKAVSVLPDFKQDIEQQQIELYELPISNVVFTETVDHYKIVGNLPQYFGPVLADQISKIRTGYKDIFGEYSTQRCTIWVFGSAEEWHRYTKLKCHFFPCRAGTWNPLSNEIAICLAYHPDVWKSELAKVIAEECLYKMPFVPWLYWGCMEYLSGCFLAESKQEWHNISIYWRNYIQEYTQNLGMDELSSWETWKTYPEFVCFSARSHAALYVLLQQTSSRTILREYCQKLRQNTPLDKAYKDTLYRIAGEITQSCQRYFPKK